MTDSHAGDAQPTPRLLSGRRIKSRMAAASVAILALGVWLAPRAPQTPAPLSAPQERAAPLLEEQVQLREASPPFLGVQDVAMRVREHSVAIALPAVGAIPTRNDFSGPITRPSWPAGFGAFVSDIYVLVHSVTLGGRSTVQIATADGRRGAAQVVAYEPSTGLALLQTEPGGRPSATLADDVPLPGTLAVAVGRWDGADVAVPVFVTGAGRDRYRISAVDDEVRRGMPVYNLQGELLAIAAPDGAELLAFPAREAATRLIARAAAGERLSSIGVTLQAPAGALARIFGDKGVVLANVVEGGPADQAGLQAGDVLLAIGDVEVDSVDTATRALSSRDISLLTMLHVTRGGRGRVIEVRPAPAYDVAALARARAPDPTQGIDVRLLFPATVLDREGIPSTARLVSINRRPVSSVAQARRALRPARIPALMLLRQGDQQFFAAIEPTR